MVLAGLQKLTLLDYPGKVACIVFTQGCNFACGYCHNPEMIPLTQASPRGLSEERFFEFLEGRQGLLDGVVITGGEPTLQRDLKGFMRKIKSLGFQIKLDTNGSNPAVLRAVLQEGLVDFVAMDLKTTPSKYKALVKNEVAKQIVSSIRILMSSGVDYEFRSTILPFCHSEEDLREMGALLKGATRWALQSFRPMKTFNVSFRGLAPFDSEELARLKSIAEQYARQVEIRQ